MTKRILTITVSVATFAALAQNAHASGTLNVPDAGSTSLLLVAACGALAFVRRFLR